MSSIGSFHVGDRVRVERDEACWPSRGTWPRYRAKVGTVVAVNRRDREVGVAWMRPTDLARAHAESWFLPHELVPAGSPKASGTPHSGAQRLAEPREQDS